jgi:hypothetical protein
MAWLQQCDLFIAEVSGSSFGLGFETRYLLGRRTREYAAVEEVEEFVARNVGWSSDR